MSADLHRVKKGWGAVKEVVGDNDDDLNEFIQEAQSKNIQVGHTDMESALMGDLGRVAATFDDDDDEIAAFRRECAA